MKPAFWEAELYSGALACTVWGFGCHKALLRLQNERAAMQVKSTVPLHFPVRSLSEQALEIQREGVAERTLGKSCYIKKQTNSETGEERRMSNTINTRSKAYPPGGFLNKMLVQPDIFRDIYLF